MQTLALRWLPCVGCSSPPQCARTKQLPDNERKARTSAKKRTRKVWEVLINFQVDFRSSRIACYAVKNTSSER